MALHVHLLEVGEQDLTQGMGSLGSTVPAVLRSFPVLVTAMVRTSHRTAGGTQERCGLVISGVSTAQALGPAWGCGVAERVSCPWLYNVSYLQLAHLPQVSGAAFLRSSLHA